jgi:hypothetical protein
VAVTVFSSCWCLVVWLLLCLLLVGVGGVAVTVSSSCWCLVVVSLLLLFCVAIAVVCVVFVVAAAAAAVVVVGAAAAAVVVVFCVLYCCCCCCCCCRGCCCCCCCCCCCRCCCCCCCRCLLGDWVAFLKHSPRNRTLVTPTLPHCFFDVAFFATSKQANTRRRIFWRKGKRTKPRRHDDDDDARTRGSEPLRREAASSWRYESRGRLLSARGSVPVSRGTWQRVRLVLVRVPLVGVWRVREKCACMWVCDVGCAWVWA